MVYDVCDSFNDWSPLSQFELQQSNVPPIIATSIGGSCVDIYLRSGSVETLVYVRPQSVDISDEVVGLESIFSKEVNLEFSAVGETVLNTLTQLVRHSPSSSKIVPNKYMLWFYGFRFDNCTIEFLSTVLSVLDG